MRIAIRILNTSTNSEQFAGHDGLIGAIPPTAVGTSIFCTSIRSCSSFGGEAMSFNILQKNVVPALLECVCIHWHTSIYLTMHMCTNHTWRADIVPRCVYTTNAHTHTHIYIHARTHI